MNKNKKNKYAKELREKKKFAQEKIEKYLATHRINKSKCLVKFNHKTNRINKLKKNESVAVLLQRGIYNAKVTGIYPTKGKVGMVIHITFDSNKLKIN